MKPNHMEDAQAKNDVEAIKQEGLSFNKQRGSWLLSTLKVKKAQPKSTRMAPFLFSRGPLFGWSQGKPKKGPEAPVPCWDTQTGPATRGRFSFVQRLLDLSPEDPTPPLDSPGIGKKGVQQTQAA